MVSSIDRSFWKKYKEHLQNKSRQEEIVIRQTEMGLLQPSIVAYRSNPLLCPRAFYIAVGTAFVKSTIDFLFLQMLMAA